MCGIYGYFKFTDTDADPIDRHIMGSAIAHRGPDERGDFDAGFALIGNQRLSIIDVEHGQQPFVSECGQVAVVQNGEIYNYKELAADLETQGVKFDSHSDTEVLLHLYLRNGKDFVHALNGMFSIAIVDKRVNQLHLYRDRIGVKPLFITQHNGALLFASEIKAMIAAGVPAEIDRQSLDAFLSFNFVPPPATIIKGVTHVEPGMMMTVTSSGITSKRWWSLADSSTSAASSAEFQKELLDTLADAVRIRMRCDVPYGAFLSGGLDSSSVVALMSAASDKPISTFSIGFDDKRFDESPYAREVADLFHTRHTLRKLSPDCFDTWPEALFYCDQPHGDVSFVPTMSLSELAAANVKVVLTGDGGDELFAGYEKYQCLFADDLSAQDFPSRVRDSLTLFPDDLKAELCGDYFADIDLNATHRYVADLLAEVPHFDPINQALYVDCRMLLPGNNLVKPDRMGMAKSLEARTPFLDYRMMELAFRMPGELKLADGETKSILKKAVLPLLGDALTYRTKQMFTVPVGEWFKVHLQGYMREVLGPKGLGGRGIFNSSVIDRLMDEHTNGTKNHTRELRALMAVEIWMQEFVEGSPVREPWWKPGMKRAEAQV